MKKILPVVLAILLMLSVFPVLAEITGRDQSSAGKGVDVVIVLDNTNSMEKNDENNNRLDAAFMLIGMMDMDKSRVALVPFAGKPNLINGLKGFTRVNTAAERNTLASAIYGLKSQLKPNTNTGAALMQALYMLEQRDDKTNDPMIILLTDGTNSIAAGSSPINVSPAYRVENGSIRQCDISYDMKMADEVTAEAVNYAAEKGIPIYVIGLGEDVEKANTIGLSNIPAITGVENGYKHTRDADQLPEFFAAMLAKRIGSSLQKTDAPTVAGENGNRVEYDVEIPIMMPKSIAETNIVIPLTRYDGRSNGIDPTSIKVFDPNGEQLIAPHYYLFKANDGNIAVVKIRNAGDDLLTRGTYHLRYSSDKDIGMNNICFNMLYNYDIQLRTKLADDTHTTKDKVHLTSSFVNVDEDGKIVSGSDSDLYRQDYTGNQEWLNIRAEWILTDKAGNMIDKGEIPANDGKTAFETDIDLAAYTGLRAGEYKIRVNVKGAGMERSTETALIVSPAGYVLDFRVEGPKAGDGDDTHYAKNSKLTVVAKLIDPKDKKPVPAEQFKEYGYEDLKMDGTSQKWTVNEDSLSFALQTDNKAAKHTFSTAMYDDAGNRISGELAIEIPYLPPLSLNYGVIIRYDGEKTPSFLHALIGKPTPANDAAYTLKPEEMFTAFFGEKLSYSEPVSQNEKELRFEKQEDGNYRVIPGNTASLFHYNTTVSATVDATDGEGNVTTCVYVYSLTNLRWKLISWIVYVVSALILIVALVLVIRQAGKPSFPRDPRLTVTVTEPPAFPHEPTEIAPTKKPVALSQLGVDDEIAARHGITLKQVANITLVPGRNKGSVKLICKTIEPGHTVKLNDKLLRPRKEEKWSIGGELEIEGEGSGTVNVELGRKEEESTVYGAASYEDTSWGEIGDVNRSRKSKSSHSADNDNTEW